MNTTTTPDILCVSGLKNSGKSALIEALIPLLAEKGVRTAVIKHHGHGFGDEIPDKPGTDTYRFLSAGACGTVIYDKEMLALVKRQSVQTEELAAYFPEADLIIIEGAKDEPYPRIAMLRTGQNLSEVTSGKGSILCAVTDCDYDTSALPENLPRFDFGDNAAVCDAVLNYLDS